MTAFPFLEQSDSAAAPITLYEFTVAQNAWYLNTSAKDIVLGGNTYVAQPCQDDGVKQTGEEQTDQITISIPFSHPVAQLFAGTPPSDPVNVTIRQTNLGACIYVGSLLNSEQMLAVNAPVVWVGFVLSVKRPTPARSEILCQTLAQTFEKNGLRLCWSRSCPYMLYDPSTCTQEPSSYGVNCTASSFGGNKVVTADLSAYPDGDFTNGYAEWLTSLNVFSRRGIESHAQGTLTLMGLTDGLVSAFTVYPGCDRTVDRCNSRFSNLSNCGATPQLPGNSPFDSNLIY
jgi:uncharacterized phage protein (TIGR02218 family)